MTRFDKHPELIVRRDEPFNGGPPPERLAASFETPAELFFVRNHGDVPQIDPGSWRLEVDGEVERPLTLGLDELAAGFPAVELTAALQCAGNRRQEMAEVRPVPGELPWDVEAVGNARWKGVPLAAVLAAAGVRPAARHVAFTGLDRVEKEGESFPFGGSVPIDKALAGEVLLAYEMNGRPLPAVHGAPVRALVPGYVGARSVKWLGRVSAAREPSENFFQRRSYRLFPPGVDSGTADWERGVMLGDFPVHAVICRPAGGGSCSPGAIEVSGFALAGGGRRVVEVEVSGDGGASWSAAELGEGGRWSWRLWRAAVDLEPGRRQLVARARDDAGNAQPERGDRLWNFKGYLYNAQHRVTVEVG